MERPRFSLCPGPLRERNPLQAGLAKRVRVALTFWAGERNQVMLGEALTGIALGQLTRKGTPMIYGSSTTAMDLRFGTASVGSPECGMINAAVARLGNYYGLPTWAAGG